MTTELLSALERSNLVDAAFDIGQQLSGGVYSSDFAASVSFFTTLPCAETAANLIAMEPKFAQILVGHPESFCRTLQAHERGPKCEGFEAFVAERLRNLAINAGVHRFLRSHVSTGSARIGFHSSRDQAILHQRLALMDLKKPWLAEPREFIRNTITKIPGAFRIVSDSICLFGVVGGRELWWDTVGQPREGQWYLASEVLCDLGPSAAAFSTMLASARQLNSPRGA